MRVLNLFSLLKLSNESMDVTPGTLFIYMYINNVLDVTSMDSLLIAGTKFTSSHANLETLIAHVNKELLVRPRKRSLLQLPKETT